MKIFKQAITFIMLLAMVLPLHAALNLTGTVAIEKSAATAGAAKTAAFNEARRQIATTALSRYADPTAVTVAVTGASDSELANMVETSSIEDEKTSATVYSANITMTLSAVAAEKFLGNHNIPNYMEAANDVDDRTTIFFGVSGLRQWTILMRELREQNLDRHMQLKTMQGRTISTTIPANMRGEYVGALRTLGWTVSDTDGILRVRKN